MPDVRADRGADVDVLGSRSVGACASVYLLARWRASVPDASPLCGEVELVVFVPQHY